MSDYAAFLVTGEPHRLWISTRGNVYVAGGDDYDETSVDMRANYIDVQRWRISPLLTGRPYTILLPSTVLRFVIGEGILGYHVQGLDGNLPFFVAEEAPRTLHGVRALSVGFSTLIRWERQNSTAEPPVGTAPTDDAKEAVPDLPPY